MKPHIEIRTDKPEELLKALDAFKVADPADDWRATSDLARSFKDAHFRLVETEHQDFTNRETFSIALFIDNDREALCTWLENARAALRVSAPEIAEDTIAEWMKSYFEDGPMLKSPWVDLLECALCRVDWLDLARHYIGKIKEGVSV